MKQRYLHPELEVDDMDFDDIICGSLTEDENYSGEDGGEL